MRRRRSEKGRGVIAKVKRTKRRVKLVTVKPERERGLLPPESDGFLETFLQF